MLNFKLVLPVFITVATLTLSLRGQDNIFFTENKGMYDSRVAFAAGFKGLHFYLEKNAFTYKFFNTDDLGQLMGHASGNEIREPGNPDYNKVRFHVFKTHFLNTNRDVKVVGENQLDFYFNYFIGKNSDLWKKDVKNYTTVYYSELWKGIDMKVYSYLNDMKYDYIIKPYASVNSIKVKYEGQDKVYVESGNVYIITSLGTVVEKKPFAYQVVNGVKKSIKCCYVLNNNELQIKILENYDSSIELIIDPALQASTFTGSGMDNWGKCSTFDCNGNIVTAGSVSNYFGSAYPVTLGAYDVTFNGGVNQSVNNGHPCDIVIDKFNSTGTKRLFATFIGGNNNEEPQSIATNSKNEIFILGRTKSRNYPTTITAFDTSHNGNTDLVVSKLNSMGSVLIASTFVGGSMDDGINFSEVWSTHGNLKYSFQDDNRGEIEVYPFAGGDVFVVSSTQSANFPVTNNAFDITLGGVQDGVAFKMDSALSSLKWCTFIGGSNDDAAYSIDITGNTSVYIAGGTMSLDFPVTTGVVSNSLSGTHDAFVIQLNANATAPIHSTYLGTSGYDQAHFISYNAVLNKVYLFGQTTGNWSVSPGMYNVAGGKNFIQILDTTLSNSLGSTVIGNSTPDQYPSLSPTAFSVSDCGNIYGAGWGRCTYWANNINMPGPTNGTMTMPVTSNAFQKNTDGCDYYMFCLSKNGVKLSYASYFGSNVHEEHSDGAMGRIDENGILYQSVCAGCGGGTGTTITTPGAVSSVNGNSSNCNLLALIVDLNPSAHSSSACYAYTSCVNDSVCFSSNNAQANSYSWNFGEPTSGVSNTSQLPNPCHAYSAPGTYTVTLLIADSNACNNPNQINYLVNISATPNVTYTQSPSSFCDTVTNVIPSLATPPGGIYTGAGVTGGVFHPSLVGPGTYTIVYTYNTGGCLAVDTEKVVVSICLSVEEYNINDYITVYPNPSSGLIIIEQLVGNREYDFEIYNLIGEKVYVGNHVIENKKTIDVSKLQGGSYFIRFIWADTPAASKNVLSFNLIK